MEVDEVVDDMVAQVLIDDPVHELEAGEGHWENDPTVLVNVRSRHAEHLVQVLHVALRIGRRRRRGRGRSGVERRRRRDWWEGRQEWRDGQRGRLLVSVSSHARVFSRSSVAVATYGVLARATLAMHFRVVHFKVDRL